MQDLASNAKWKSFVLQLKDSTLPFPAQLRQCHLRVQLLIV